MQRITVYVPVDTEVQREALEAVKTLALAHFGGVTLVLGMGAWRGAGGRVYHEPVTLVQGIDWPDCKPLYRKYSHEEYKLACVAVLKEAGEEAVLVTCEDIQADLY